MSERIHLKPQCNPFAFREYRKKMETAKARMSAISKKQKETESIANFSVHNEKK